jgi:enoyl reductase-like protein
MFVRHENRWVDVSLRNLTGDWLRRVEERFAGVNGSGGKHSLLQNFSTLNDPLPFVGDFFNAYPLAKGQLLASEDRAYFLAISQRPGQKPVPFIPVLDANFEVWFKKVRRLSLHRYFVLILFHRILCGLPKILRPFSIKTPSVFVSFKDLLLSSTQR